MRPYELKRMPLALFLVIWCTMLNLMEAAPAAAHRISPSGDLSAGIPVETNIRQATMEDTPNFLYHQKFDDETLPEGWTGQYSEQTGQFEGTRCDFLTSYELDLTKAIRPVIVTNLSYNYLSVSTDGKNFSNGLWNSKDSNSFLAVPRDTKFIRITNTTKWLWVPLKDRYLFIFDAGDSATDYSTEVNVEDCTVRYVDGVIYDKGNNSWDKSLRYYSVVTSDAFRYGTAMLSLPNYIDYNYTVIARTDTEYITLPERRFYTNDLRKYYIPPTTQEIFIYDGDASKRPKTNNCSIIDYGSQFLALTVAEPKIPYRPSAYYDINADGTLDFVNDAIYLSDGSGYTGFKPENLKGGNLMNAGGDNGILWYDGHIRHVDYKNWAAPVIDGDESDKNHVYYPADLDNDGRLDLLKLGANEYVPSPQRYFAFDATGRGTTGKLNVMSLDEYLNNPVYVGKSDVQSVLASMSGMDIWSPTPSEKSAGTAFELHDINNDGLPDIVDFVHGKIYYNLGSDGFATADFGGQMLLRDLNGDGIEDFILHDRKAGTTNSYIRQPDGSMKEKQILSGYYMGWKMFAADVNNDGYVDLVLPISSSPGYYTINTACTFILIMENKGDGTFKTHECPLPATSMAFDLRDTDNDGHYELFLTCEGTSYGTGTLVRYGIENCKLSSTPETLPTKENVKVITSYNPAETPDFPAILPHVSNPGGYVIGTGGATYSNGSSASILYKLPAASNQPPAAPGRPDIFYEPSSGILNVNWEPSSDAETPAADLTYAVRVGTAPGLDDIVTADALTDGRRRNFTGGNAGHSLHRKFDTSTWPDGEIYISVQAVDGANGGSAFSEYAVFEKQEPANSFRLTYEMPLSIGNKITVALSSSPKEGYNYEWDFADGHIISSDEHAQTYEIRFTTPGEKNISLTVSSPGNTAPTISQTIDVQAAAITPGKISMDYNDIYAAADLDEDGLDEISGYCGMLYESLTPGAYTKIPRLYNNHASISSLEGAVATDFNGDGHVDLWGSGGVMAVNQEDKGMEIMTDMFDGWVFEYKSDYYMWLDLNNSGHLDYVAQNSRMPYEYGVFSNDPEAPYRFFSPGSTLPDDIGKIYRWEDYTGDGLADFIAVKSVRNGKEWVFTCRIYENQGDFTFTPLEPFFEATEVTIKDIRDFDNNGKLDVLYSRLTDYGTYSLFMRWDNGDETPVLSGVGGNDSGQVILGVNYNQTYSRHDLDNNGYIDIYAPVAESVRKSHGLLGYIAYLRPGRIFDVKRLDWQSSDYGELVLRGEPFVASDGKRYLATNQSYRYTFDTPNTKPEAPTNLRHSQNAKAIVIEWDPSMDKETPGCRMRYNVSIKHKGMEGEGAYMISPCNGGKNGVSVPTNKQLTNSNRFTIPVAAIPAGEYEVKVQGVDLMHEASDFSEVYLMTVEESCSFELPATGEVNYPIEVKTYTHSSNAPDWDGGEIESSTTGRYTVVWHTPGRKCVTIGEKSAWIHIKEAPDANFALPLSCHRGDRVELSGPNIGKGEWEIHVANSPSGWERLSAKEDSRFASLEIIDDENAVLKFRITNRYEIRHSLSEGFATAQHTGTVTVESPDTPAIRLVDIDEATGKHRICWNAVPTDSPDIIGLNLYKETSVAGKYMLISQPELTATSYVDLSSTPDAKSSRYMMTYQLKYGESADGVAHKSIHVMINRSIGDSWNLIWTRYEGIDIATYRILRGDSPENLSMIDEVSGSMTSYCDVNPPAGPLFYAVEIITQAGAGAPASNGARNAAQTLRSRSNVVVAGGDASVNPVERIEVYSVNGGNTINYQEATTLDLLARVYPFNATITTPNWIVTSGENIVSVDARGRVTATGLSDGKATVQACAIDGSGVSGEFTIYVTGVVSGMESAPTIASDDLTVYPAVADVEIRIDGLPTDGNDRTQLYIFGVNGLIVHEETLTDSSATVNVSALTRGVYIVKATGEHGTAAARFIKR